MNIHVNVYLIQGLVVAVEQTKNAFILVVRLKRECEVQCVYVWRRQGVQTREGRVCYVICHVWKVVRWRRATALSLKLLSFFATPST
jgi:hypothetical protein